MNLSDIRVQMVRDLTERIMYPYTNYEDYIKYGDTFIKEIKIKDTTKQMDNNLDLQYQALLQDILDNGNTKNDRTGTGTLSVFGRQIRHSMADGFPLLTTKKMSFKNIAVELIWFLRGDTNIKYLLDNDCNIWTGDAYKNYLNDHALDADYYTQEEFIEKIKTDDEFAKKWGDLGRVYGAQWRNWSVPKISPTSLEDVIDTLCEVGNGVTDEMLHNEGYRLIKERDSNKPIDQIANLINDLRNNPDSRRMMVTAWNPADIPNSVLPPCHYGFQLYTRELSLKEYEEIASKEIGLPANLSDIDIQNMPKWFKTNLDINVPTRAISLQWSQRSVDSALGLPYNIASYALLLMMIAKTVNMVPDELIGNLGDTHIYLNQLDGVNEQLSRDSFDLPTVTISDRVVSDISEYTIDDIKLENYISQPKIYFPLSN